MFISYGFIGFLALFFLLYYMVPRRLQPWLLLVANAAFYLSANLVYPLFLLATATTIFLAGLKLRRLDEQLAAWQPVGISEDRGEISRQKKAFKKEIQKQRKTYMLLALFCNLGILIVVKYANFAIDNVNGILGLFQKDSIANVEWVIPLGISFYTFQAVGYLMDVYWNKTEAQTNYFRFLLFLSFFPQLIQGPISRYEDLSQTLYAEHPFRWDTFSYGLERILWGYFKKLVVADRLSVALATLSSDPVYYTGAWVLIATILWSIELYADFTGGIDITIGIAEACGISVKENFERPYFSKNLAEFWRRWHISMGTWFRDYVFYPLSISHALKSLTKSTKKHFGAKAARRVSVYVSTMLVWLATGIWHGAAWNYVVWGLLNGVILLLSEECKPLYDSFHRRFPGAAGSMGYQAFQMLRTFLLVCMLRLFDVYPSVPVAGAQFVKMFSNWGKAVLSAQEFLDLGLTGADYLLVLAGTALMLAASIMGRKQSVRKSLARACYPVHSGAVFVLFLCVLLFGAYGTGYDAHQFIYNQF